MSDESQDKAWQLTAAAGVQVVLAATVSGVVFDRRLSLWVSRLPDSYREFGAIVTQVGDANLWLIGAGVLTAGAIALRMRTLALRAGWVLASVGVAGIAANVLKWVFGRWRPGAMLDPDKFDGAKYGFDWFETGFHRTGFPSGHATTIFAVFGVLWLIWPRAWWVWLPVATALALTRVLVNAHYLSDVMAGAWLGFATALLLRDAFTRETGLGVRLADGLGLRKANDVRVAPPA
ncbi:MAG: phosphatase PAP2 family protein [Phycisphaera sp.]|nr:phosphatase PAP2 family protein [Phycisphaera sp.]